MSEYTSKPWKAIIEEEQPVPYYKRLICTVEHGDEYKAVVAEKSEVCNREEWESNTRLIAAPELLEAAEDIIPQLELFCEQNYFADFENYKKLRKAIQKAEGDNDED